MKTIGIIATTIAVMAFSATINGWALSILWGWFITPIFDAPILTIPYAIGLSLVVSYMTAKISTKKDDRDWNEQLMIGVMAAVTKSFFSLAFGWVVLQFV